MGRAPTHGLAHGDALQIQLVGDGAHTGLGAFVVDVPALKVLQGRGIHDDQGRVNDGAGIHQSPRQGVATSMHAGVGAADHRQGSVGMDGGVHTRGQVHRTDGEVDFAWAVLARQIRQGAGLGPAHISLAAQGAHTPCHGEAAKSAGGQKNHLTVMQMRGHGLGNVVLGNGRGGQHNQLSPAQGHVNIGADAVDGHIAFTIAVFEANAAFGQDRREGRAIPPPQTHFMPRQG